MDPNTPRWAEDCDTAYPVRPPSNGMLRALRRIATPNAMTAPAPKPVPSPADLLTPTEADLLVFPIVTGTLRFPKDVA